MDATHTLLEQYGTPVSHPDATLPVDSDGILTKHLPAPEILGQASDGSCYFLVQYAASSVNFTEDDFEKFCRKFCSRVFHDQGRYLLSFWPVWIDRTLIRDAYDLPDPSVQPWRVFHRTVDDPDGLHKLLLALASEQHQDLHTATLTSIDQWTRVTASPKEIWKLCEYDRSISVLDQGNAFPESLVLGGCFAFVRLSNPLVLHRSTSHGDDIWDNHHPVEKRRQVLNLSVGQTRCLHRASSTNRVATAVYLESPSQGNPAPVARRLTIENQEGVRLKDVLTSILGKSKQSDSIEPEPATVYIEFPHSICPSVQELEKLRSKGRRKRPSVQGEGTPKQNDEEIRRERVIDWICDRVEQL